MSLLIVSLLVLGAALVAAKVYFQYKEEQDLKKQNASQQEEQNADKIVKTNEQIIAERLAEIAEFEKEVVETKQSVVEVKVEEAVVTEVKAKPRKKKFYRPKKQQPKIKAQNKQQ